MTALIRDAQGQLHLILATIPKRMTNRQLECWAATGDRQMMLALGRRLEAGDGVARDPSAAEKLYQRAATPRSGDLWIYVPGVGGAPGRVTNVRSGPDEPGLPAAAYARALMHLEGRASRPSYRKGIRLLRDLSAAGYPPAKARYEAIMAGPRS